MFNPFTELIKTIHLTKVDTVKLHTNYQRIEFVTLDSITLQATTKTLTLREVTKEYIKAVEVVNGIPKLYTIKLEYLTQTQARKVLEYLRESEKYRNLA